MTTAKKIVTNRVKTRKKTPSIVPPPEDSTKNLECIKLYLEGKTHEEIAEAVGWEPLTVQKKIQEHFVAVRDLYETEVLVRSQGADDNNMVRTPLKLNLYKSQKTIDKDINKDFIEKLSGPEDMVLTQEESLFCYLMVHEGDEVKALQDSGLSGGLLKSSKSYKQALRLRCLMLKGKKNIIRKINELQINYAKELHVSREMIQAELMGQIRRLKELNDPKHAGTIQRLTRDLGQTVGAFIEKVEVSEISFDDAMDLMMANREKKLLEAKKKGDDPTTYIYDPEAIG